MKRIKLLWMRLPKRHRLAMILLLLVALLLALVKLGGNAPETIAAPPLPSLPASPSQPPSSAVPTTAGDDLRLAARRPILTSPGLEFVDHGAVAATRVTPEPEPEPTKAQPVSEAGRKPPSVAPKAPPVANQFATLPADAWLLQVAAAPNEEQAKARCQGLALACTSYAAKRQGRQVWILVVGPYASRDAALAAVARLPVKLRQQGPFARQVAEVRKDAGG